MMFVLLAPEMKVAVKLRVLGEGKVLPESHDLEAAMWFLLMGNNTCLVCKDSLTQSTWTLSTSL